VAGDQLAGSDPKYKTGTSVLTKKIFDIRLINHTVYLKTGQILHLKMAVI
jgi:hypothetical protein